jgi:hypothetical protein
MPNISGKRQAPKIERKSQSPQKQPIRPFQKSQAEPKTNFSLAEPIRRRIREIPRPANWPQIQLFTFHFSLSTFHLEGVILFSFLDFVPTLILRA